MGGGDEAGGHSEGDAEEARHGGGSEESVAAARAANKASILLPNAQAHSFVIIQMNLSLTRLEAQSPKHECHDQTLPDTPPVSQPPSLSFEAECCVVSCSVQSVLTI